MLKRKSVRANPTDERHQNKVAGAAAAKEADKARATSILIAERGGCKKRAKALCSVVALAECVPPESGFNQAANFRQKAANERRASPRRHRHTRCIGFTYCW